MNSICTYAFILGLLALTGCMPGGAPTALNFKESPYSASANRGKSIEAFKQTVYPLGKNNSCVNCHSSSTKNQSPVFADSNVEKAFDAITLSMKVDLVTPASSRVVIKIKNESHNCWSGNCEADSALMLEAVKKWVQLAPPTDSSGGIPTGTMVIPPDSAYQLAQTEHGALLLQAEQPYFWEEVTSGRFSAPQDSGALAGKYLLLTPPESNPVTNAPRNLAIDTARFDSCKEFDDADIAPATRALRIMQARTHIPSGETGTGGKIINDGYRPYTTGFNMSLIRPDRRIEYARMLYNANLVNLTSVLVPTGAPARVTMTQGQRYPDNFSGELLEVGTELKVLPYFVPHSMVFNPDGSFKTNGSFTKDDGSTDTLFNLFRDGAYSPSPEVLQQNLTRYGFFKTDTLYKQYRETVNNIFYDSATRRISNMFPYNTAINMDVITYFSPEVAIELRCPNGQTCGNPEQLKFHVVNNSGTPLTQANALDCYTLNTAQTQLMPASAASCNGSNPKFFHFIDLFMNVSSDESTFNTQSVPAYASRSQNLFQNQELFDSVEARRLVYIPNQAQVELDPDVFFSGGANSVTDDDNQRNFGSTLHTSLKQTRCFDCHGSGAANPVQFASANVATSLSILKTQGLVNLDAPANSFRPGGMVHNCNPGAPTGDRYSCSAADENALRKKLSDAITAWKQANIVSAQAAGAKSSRTLSRNERLPGRANYKFKVTSSGLYNVWMKVKDTTTPGSLNFRILTANGSPVPYTVGTSTNQVANACFKWAPGTTLDMWEWTTPGRASELPAIDQRGYILLNDQKQPLPLPNNRLYFNLSEGTYTLDMLGLTEGLRVDAVGINRVEDMKVDTRLQFQPDRRAIDEKHISDYKRKVLRFDLSNQLGLNNGKQAFFEIEAKREFEGQNYVFRNPRFITSPRSFNIAVKGIKVFINGKWNFPDATFNTFEAITGDNQVLSYAPLLALTGGKNSVDQIHFKFDKLTVTNEGLSNIYPRGNPPAEITDRRCADLDYFIKNVKPILFNARVALNTGIKDYNDRFPGGPRNGPGMGATYNCVSCHTQQHPYFKMSTFTNNEEFCREALSRVDFQNFYQSLVIRGINGTGNHPKFVFIEKFVTGSDGNFKAHDNGQDYMLGRYKNPSGIASNLLPGPVLTWTKADLGITKTNYSDLTVDERARITKVGLYRRLQPKRINLDVLNYSWYSSPDHHNLMYSQNDPTQLDNILSAYDVINPTPGVGRIDTNRNRGPMVYDVLGDVNGVPATVGFQMNETGPAPLKGSFKQYATNGEPGFDPTTIDYISTTPEQNAESEMWDAYETERDYYREKIISWIRRENAARTQEK